MRKFFLPSVRRFRHETWARPATVVLVIVAALAVGAAVWIDHADSGGVGVHPEIEHVQEPVRSNTSMDPGEERVLSLPWGSWWVYAVSGVAAVGLVFVLVRWRTAYLDRQRHRLEHQVAERTREVDRQKRKLEAYNRELLRTNEQLRTVIEEKSQLLGVAAHDLKNPLFGIRALSEILLDGELPSEGAKRKLHLIHESADETLRLINNLLTSAANSSKEASDFEPVDLSGLTRWVVHSFEPQAEQKEQDLSCSIAAADCVVEGDKHKLREALRNLVSNAVKYSPQGGTVHVAVDRDDGVVRVDVADTGPGLSESDQERLFMPFQRLTPEPTGGESSSGLGLYIVKEIVDLHDGDVVVDSAPGEGSTFTIQLPASDSALDPGSGVEPPNQMN